jgi:hypothetical protein
MNTKEILLSLLWMLATSASAEYICKADDVSISTFGPNQIEITKYLCASDTIKNIQAESYEVEYEAVLFNNGKKSRTLRADRISIENTPYKFPYLVIRLSYYSAANSVQKYKIYKTEPYFKEVATIDNLITTSMANKGKGSYYFADGFYTNIDGNFFIDRITTRGTPMAKCNSCQTYNIETLKLTNDGFISVYLRSYDMDSYKHYKTI